MKTIKLTDEEIEFVGQLLDDDMISADMYLSVKSENNIQIEIAKRHLKLSKQILKKIYETDINK